MQTTPALPWDWQNGGVLELAQPVTRSQLLAGILEANFSDGTKSTVEEDAEQNLYFAYNGEEFTSADWWGIVIESSTRLRIVPNLTEEDSGPVINSFTRLNPASIVSTDPELPTLLDIAESIFVKMSKPVDNAFIGKIGITQPDDDSAIYPELGNSRWVWKVDGVDYWTAGLLDGTSNTIEITAATDGTEIDRIVTAYDA